LDGVKVHYRREEGEGDMREALVAAWKREEAS
jgi:hypothetical protein